MVELRHVDERGLDLLVDGAPWIRGASPRVVWREPGAGAWVDSAGGSGALPGRFVSTFRSCPLSAEVDVRRLDDRSIRVSGTLRNVGEAEVELARFHYLHGGLAGAAQAGVGLLAPTPHAESCRLFRRGDRLPPVKTQAEELWASMFVHWPRMADPIHLQPDWALAVDVGVLTPAWDAQGLLLGFTDPIRAFGEIGLRTRGEEAGFFAGLLLDGVVLGPGERRELDALFIRHGDWQENMRAWALSCAAAAGVRSVREPLVGYCSWYQYGHLITSEHIRRASREVAAWPIPPGGRTVQIDDGFQVMPGDWGPNERFRDGWDALPAEIAAAGSVPGLWLAPHAVFHRHPVVAEHPDWVQRLPSGEPAVSFSNWGWCSRPDWKWGEGHEPTYYLDPDHPRARTFMHDIVSGAVRQGWRYLKLDFTYAVSTARLPADPRKTRMETLRGMYELFRDAAGPATIICACIGEMGRYALGLADTARLGGDIGSEWRSIKQNLPDTLIRMSTNGTWWVGDPDVFHMREENLRMSPEEAWCLTGTVGLLGGVFLTSDFPTQWAPPAAELVRQFWNREGPPVPADARVAYTAAGTPAAARFSHAGPGGATHRVAVYNWGDEPATVSVSLSALGGLESPALAVRRAVPSSAHAELAGARLVCRDMAAHSLRIVELSGGPS
jgi:hypothetical protein